MPALAGNFAQVRATRASIVQSVANGFGIMSVYLILKIWLIQTRFRNFYQLPSDIRFQAERALGVGRFLWLSLHRAE